MFSFTILHRDGSARTGIIRTLHGDIKTPAFIPVATKGTVKSLLPEQVHALSFDAILANTLHLHLQPGEAIVEKMGGLHSFSGWKKPFFTDSGGFQVFSLGEKRQVDDDGVTFTVNGSPHRLTPESSMQIQKKLGADLIFAFDECLEKNADEAPTKKSLARSHAWAVRSLAEFRKLNTDGTQALYGIVQGGRFPELRAESARFISSLDFEALAIGSIFGDPKTESLALVQPVMKILPEEKAKHLLGIGAVDDIFTYVELGLDTFDCVLPTRLARMGYAFIRPESGGKVENKFRMKMTAAFREDPSPLDKHCHCSVCRDFSRSYLWHLHKAQELSFYTLMTMHNLFFFSRLLQEIREAIEKGQFQQLKKSWDVRN
ncbi:tRNA guanosine(34) transglycosylase Tgt [Candidatus Woesearchaeota archaeon]|nr:tRNA guanosine(34) transglycosylase Tgt [Candidatus Woesearchaeota archaeon]